MPGRDEGPALPLDWTQTPEEDLWFLPGPDAEEDDPPPGAPPLPHAPHARLLDPADWRRAQNALSDDLARLTQVFGELDARLRGGHDGLRQRLAQREAADLSWWSGDRLSLDRLGLWSVLRIGSTEDTEQALARAGWVVRRLNGGPAPAEGMTAFLERPDDGAGEGETDLGPDSGALTDLTALLTECCELHPVTQSAILFQAWRLLGAPASRDMEAAVLAARHAASMSRRPGQGAMFLPLIMSGAGALRGQGDPEEKLKAWISGAERATLAALLHLDSVTDWKQKARRAVADLSGRTPARLIDVLATWPLVSAPLAEAETGASRAAVQRNLERLAARGLIREMTGQGRYRIWCIC